MQRHAGGWESFSSGFAFKIRLRTRMVLQAFIRWGSCAWKANGGVILVTCDKQAVKAAALTNNREQQHVEHVGVRRQTACNRGLEKGKAITARLWSSWVTLSKQGHSLGEKGQVPSVYHAGIQAAVRATGNRYPPESARCNCENWRPLPITQPTRRKIRKGGGWAQAEAQNEQVRSIPG